MNCGRCGIGIGSESERCELLPCHHSTCVHCTIEVHSERGSDVFKCPTCQDDVNHHFITRKRHEWPRASRSQPNPPPHEVQKQEMHPIRDNVLHPLRDSFRCFMRELESKDKDTREEIVGGGIFLNMVHVMDPPDPDDDKCNIRKIQFDCHKMEIGFRTVTRKEA